MTLRILYKRFYQIYANFMFLITFSLFWDTVLVTTILPWGNFQVLKTEPTTKYQKSWGRIYKAKFSNKKTNYSIDRQTHNVENIANKGEQVNLRSVRTLSGSHHLFFHLRNNLVFWVLPIWKMPKNRPFEFNMEIRLLV